MVSEPRSLLVVGGGGHSKVVIATAEAAGWEPIGVVDDNESLIGTRILGVEVLGRTSRARDYPATASIIAVGSNAARRSLAMQLDLPWAGIVHPAAWVDPRVQLGEGALVAAGAVLQPEVRIGTHAIINTGATIDHDCTIGPFAHIAPGTHLAGGVSIGEGALLGVGCSVVPGVTVGAWSVVGAGSVLIRDVPSCSVVAGVPARPIRSDI